MSMEISTLLQYTYELSQLLACDKRLQTLKSIEHELDNNLEVIALSQKMHNQADVYGASIDVKALNTEAQRKLHQAKFELESHPLVRRYYEAYKAVRELYDVIQSELFSPFNIHVCGVNR